MFLFITARALFKLNKLGVKFYTKDKQQMRYLRIQKVFGKIEESVG